MMVRRAAKVRCASLPMGVLIASPSVGGGWDMQCMAPPCVKAMGDLHDGETCCEGSMRYTANGGPYCKPIKPACVMPPGDLHEGESCCEGSMRYLANGGPYCHAI